MLKRLMTGLLAVMMLCGAVGQGMAASLTIKLGRGHNWWAHERMDTRITTLYANVGAGQYVYVRWNELTSNGAGGNDVNVGSMWLMPVGRDGQAVAHLAVEPTNIDPDTGWFEFVVPATGDYAIEYSPRPMFMPDIFDVKVYFLNNPVVPDTLE